MPLNQALRKNSHVLWSISLIQDVSPEAQTKAELAEMANDVISTESIDRVTMCVADHLQRFRFMIQDGLTENEAIEKCDKMAVDWRETNTETLSKLTENKKLSFITWAQFRSSTSYEATVKEISGLYQQNREFRNDVDGRIRQELKNIKPDAKITDNSQQISLLKQYLFEECAFQKFCSMQRFNYELYKTPMNKAMRRIKNNSEFVAPGCMVEVHFTQFNPSAKKNTVVLSKINPNEIDSSSSSTSARSYAPVFNSPKNTSKNEQKNEPVSPNEKKVANFIELTISLLPIEHRENAIKALIQFTNQKIIPLSYENNPNALVI
jgi:tRNA-dependent cyclodipeptide synthase